MDFHSCFLMPLLGKQLGSFSRDIAGAQGAQTWI